MMLVIVMVMVTVMSLQIRHVKVVNEKHQYWQTVFRCICLAYVLEKRNH